MPLVPDLNPLPADPEGDEMIPIVANGVTYRISLLALVEWLQSTAEEG